MSGPFALEALWDAGEALRPLHREKTPPGPGDWLDQHDEPGQTFAEYVASGPNRPTSPRTTLYLQPIGAFQPAQARLVQATIDLLGPFYNIPVRPLDPLPLDAIPDQARRLHPISGDRQILSTYVLKLLAKRRPADAAAVLALTTSDLWPGKGWNFVFGQASLIRRVGVWSVHRLGDPERKPKKALLRTLKVASHETGHMFGLRHCTAFECGMNGANHLTETDASPLAFCPEDEMKVWWACGADPVQRFEDLAEVAGRYGLEAEARFWLASRRALEAR